MNTKETAIRNALELLDAGKISVEEMQRAAAKMQEMLKNNLSNL